MCFPTFIVMCVVLVGFRSFLRLSHLVQPVSGVRCAFLGCLQAQWLSSTGPVLGSRGPTTQTCLYQFWTLRCLWTFFIQILILIFKCLHNLCVHIYGGRRNWSPMSSAISFPEPGAGIFLSLSPAVRNHCVLLHVAFYIGTRNLNSYSHVYESSA